MTDRKERFLARKRRKKGIRRKVFGTAKKPRLCVYKSNRYIYAQIIDDQASQTLASVSSQKKKMRDHNCKSVKIAERLGQELGGKAKALGIEELVFDRSGYPYEGRVRILAEGVRQEGLRF